jgi:hypothetical protein
MTKTTTRNYAVKVRQRELRAGGNKLSAARGLRGIIWIILKAGRDFSTVAYILFFSLLDTLKPFFGLPIWEI